MMTLLSVTYVLIICLVFMGLLTSERKHQAEHPGEFAVDPATAIVGTLLWPVPLVFFALQRFVKLFDGLTIPLYSRMVCSQYEEICEEQ